MPLLALTRAVSPSISRCELTHLQRTPIDLALATRQHEIYEETLAQLGCRVQRIAPEPELPDSVFVEDAAVVVDEIAVITRPGALLRRAETASVAQALAAHRPLGFVQAPGTLDGGDVLRLGRRVWVGVSTRTNAEGARQLRELLAPFGYQVETVEVYRCLHLKSAASGVADDAVLLDPSAVEASRFAGLRTISIEPGEPMAANVLRVGATLVAPAAAPRTCDRLLAAGLRVLAVEVSELAKAEAGLTCCSLLLSVPA
jgi:dimethylargininase